MSGSGGSDDWKLRGTNGAPARPASQSKGDQKEGTGIGVGAGGGVAAGFHKCAIFEETALNSPDSAVISTLRPGAILRLEQRGRTVVALTSTGQQAGSITFRRLADLLDCIGQHWTYVAEVKRVTGGMCQVYIRPDQQP